MSVKASSWAFDPKPGLSPGAKFVLVALADSADEDGIVILGRLSLAAKCQCNAVTITRHLGALEDAGLIWRKQRRRANGSRTSDWIVLAPEAEDRGPMVDATSEKRDDPELLAKARQVAIRHLTDSPGSGCNLSSSQVAECGGPDPSEDPSGDPESSANADDDESARKRKPETDPDAIRLCRLLAVLIREHDAAARLPKEGTAGRDAWVRDMRLLVKDRGGDIALVERVIQWCQADSFWASNILSPSKLRKQFTQLLLRMDAPPLKGLPGGRQPTAKEARTARRLEQMQAARAAQDQPQTPKQIEGGSDVEDINTAA